MPEDDISATGVAVLIHRFVLRFQNEVAVLEILRPVLDATLLRLSVARKLVLAALQQIGNERWLAEQGRVALHD